MTESGRPEFPSGPPGGYPPPPYPYQPGPYPGGYPPPPPVPYSGGFTPPPAGPKNGLGIASLIIAVIGLILFLSVIGGVVLGIVAVVIGFIGQQRVRRGEANNGGVSVAGIVLGFLAIVAGLAAVPIWLYIWNLVGGNDYFNCMEKAGSKQVSQQCVNDLQNRLQNQLGVTPTPTPTLTP
jgi:hypothetical protein